MNKLALGAFGGAGSFSVALGSTLGTSVEANKRVERDFVKLVGEYDSDRSNFAEYLANKDLEIAKLKIQVETKKKLYMEQQKKIAEQGLPEVAKPAEVSA